MLRGGGWNGLARLCRSANRFRYYPDGRFNFNGFRLCCSAGPRGEAELEGRVTETPPTRSGRYPARAAAHGKVQLWEDGPYWAEMNIGAENPEDYGYYFWWGDTVGYKREGNAWVASDGSARDFSFDKENTPTYDKDIDKLECEGWVTPGGVLAPKHDAAHMHWGGNWRMPRDQELEDLVDRCEWTLTTKNGVEGYVVRGRGEYASASIFLPCAGYGVSVGHVSSHGYYWSADTGYGDSSCNLNFHSGCPDTGEYDRSDGQSVRPVQGFTK